MLEAEREISYPGNSLLYRDGLNLNMKLWDWKKLHKYLITSISLWDLLDFECIIGLQEDKVLITNTKENAVETSDLNVHVHALLK